jgi:hypothetical protein
VKAERAEMIGKAEKIGKARRAGRAGKELEG